MALLSKNKNLTTSYQTLHTGTVGNQTSIHSLSFTNNTAAQVTFDLTFYSAADAATYQLATTQAVGAYKTYTWPKPINMAAGDYIQAKASSNSAIVTNTSYYESTTTVTGFTLRGTWSSSLAYSVNDIVLYGGISYAAIQASTNQTPSSATTYWQKFTEIGQTGATGATGIQGASGASGSQGIQGASGSTGLTGATGIQGPTGGASGPQGASGIGASGITGASGIQGASGATGTQGASGSTGLTGATGPTGATGVTGIQGASGSTGLHGATGEQGLQGNVGATGYGATGAHGASGVAGATGIDGASGATGPSGQLATWQIVTAATGILNKEQMIVNTSSGSFSISLPSSPILGDTVVFQDGGDWYTNNLTILRNGSTIEGQSDDLILDVTNVLVYLIYDGTTWQVVSTIGPMGASGATGPQGPTGGASGPQGASGIDGASGASGASGAPGEDGATGIDGASGASGATGPQGIQGASGATGPQGIQGASGATGEQGIQGASGATGAVNTASSYTWTGVNNFADLGATGTTTIQQVTEALTEKTLASGIVDHDFRTGSIFYHSGMTSSFTANITNVPTTANKAIVITIILNQGVTAYIPSALAINSSPQTIKWQDNTIPTGNVSKIDIVSFSLIRRSGTWEVLGGLSTYG